MFDKKIVPMEPQAKKILKKNSSFAYQVKWDGIRLLAFGKGTKIRLQSRNQKDKTGFYPELTVLPELVAAESFVLDGELVSLKNKRPSFYTLMQRERAGKVDISGAIRLPPVHYMLFDILFINGAWLLNEPWKVRQEILKESVTENGSLYLTPSYGDGKRLLQDSPYIPGPRKSGYWLKTKLEQTLEAYVGGLALRNKNPISLLLGLYENDDDKISGLERNLHYIGSVSSGLTEKELGNWYERSQKDSLNASPFINPPPARGEREFLWLKPHRKVKVVFNEWTTGLKLRAPRLAR